VARYLFKNINRRFFWMLIAFMLPSVCGLSVSHAAVLIIKSGTHQNYQNVARSISQNLKALSKTIELNDYKRNESSYSDFTSYIGIGSEAAHHLIETLPQEKKLYLSYVPRLTYLGFLKDYQHLKRVQQNLLSVIYIDHPYSRQFHLASLIKPNLKRISIALGPNSTADKSIITETASRHQLELNIDTLEADDNPVFKLQTLINGSDVFLSVPDSSLYNRTTAKWLLYISFKKRIPLIGFSKKYVYAGAVAAVISEPSQIGLQTAEMVNTHSNTNTYPTSQYPKYYQVILNTSAVRSLKLNLPSAKTLTKRLQELER